MIAELTVAARVARALMEFAASKGGPRNALAEQSGIDPADLQNGDNRIPFARYVALMRAGQALCHDPALALHFGEAIDVSEISIGCVLAGSSQTIDEAFAQVNRYTRLGVEVEDVGNGDRFQLRRNAAQLWIVDTRRNPNDFPELTEETFARMVCSTRRSLGDTQFFKALHVTHAEPVYRAEYQRIFRAPVVFGGDKNALRIDEALVSSYRVPPSSRYVSGVLKEHAEAMLKRLESSQSMRGRVEGLLLPLLRTREVSVERVTGKLGLSRQTLFRKLKLEGVTFEQVLEELRYRLALHYLTANKSVHQTAGLVGYSDSAAFSRAFKRWAGSSPRMYLSRRASSG